MQLVAENKIVITIRYNFKFVFYVWKTTPLKNVRSSHLTEIEI
jgi:hypothetical protein